jgi:hypothetical protein
VFGLFNAVLRHSNGDVLTFVTDNDKSQDISLIEGRIPDAICRREVLSLDWDQIERVTPA